MEEKPIRILIIGMHDKIGGVETFLMNYYRNINRDKIQFDFISIYDKLCFENEIKELGGIIYKITSEKKNPFKYYNELKKIIKTNNYKIVHINMLSAANILPVLVSYNLKVKHIVIHSHNSNIPSGLLRKILNSINKHFLHMGTDFWACSQLAGNWLFGKKFLKKHELVVINNAVDVEKYRYNKKIRNKIRKELNVHDEFVIGHVGRFCYQKNHTFLIDAFYEFQKIKKESILLLIGEGELKNKIYKKVNDLKINNKVIFLGTTDRVQDYLQAMDLFVLPSNFEGLPVVGIEAQVSGTNCIFSKKITQETKITDNTKFLDIDNGIQEWINEMIKCMDNFDEKNILLSDIFEIKNASKMLEKKYIEMERG